MGAAGVGGDVAPDRAGRLARRVRGVVKPVVRGVGAEVGVDDAGTHDGQLVAVVHLEDAVHAGGAHDDATARRNGAAAQPRARAAADDGNTELVGDAHHGLHLGGVLRKYNGVGQRVLH